MQCLIHWVICVAFWPQYAETIPIGLLVESGRQDEITAVSRTIHFVNNNILTTTKLTLAILTYNGNNMDAIQKSGIIALIGPKHRKTIHAIAPMFDKFNCPLLSPIVVGSLKSSYKYTVYMAPPRYYPGVALVLNQLLSTKFQILMLASLLRAASKYRWHVVSVQTFRSGSRKFDSQFQTIKYSGCRVTLLCCVYNDSIDILAEAKVRELLGLEWTWIMTQNRLGDDTNLIPVSPDSHSVAEPTSGCFSMADLPVTHLTDLRPIANKSLWVANWMDAVLALANTVRDYDGQLSPSDGMNLSSPGVWAVGSNFLSQLTKVNEPGVFQQIQFEAPYPKRKGCDYPNFQLTGWTTVATWNSDHKYVEKEKIRGHSPDIDTLGATDFSTIMNGKHFRAVTVESEPFSFFAEGRPANPNSINIIEDQYIGSLVDMVEEIARLLNFTYTMYLVPDNNWGNKNKTTGWWNGMVAELVNKRADFAFATFTISNIRSKDMDFSTHWIDMGLRAAIPKDVMVSSAWNFTLAFHKNVWIALLISVVLVGIALGFFEKISPFGFHGEFAHFYQDMEKINQTKRDRNLFRRRKRYALNVMRTDNAVWFSLASLIQQGYDHYPLASSSRIVATAWWAAILATISMYTAKLGAGMISEGLQSEINTVEQLYTQNRIQYGIPLDGAIYQFFCDNEIPLYKNMCKQMQKWNSFTTNVDATLRLADPNDQFAFISDSPIIDAMTEKEPCNLRRLGELFNKGGFGLGMQKNSVYNEVISKTILQLRENGFLQHLHDKWFVQRSECRKDEGVVPIITEFQIKFTDLKGVFYVIIFAVGISPILLVVEFGSICVSDMRQYAQAQIQISIGSILKHRFGRICHDILSYNVPEVFKPLLGLTKYKKHNQIEAWKDGTRDINLVSSMVGKPQHYVTGSHDD